MPFSFTNKSIGDLIRSQDWNAAMAAVAALYDKLHGATGHAHTGGAEDGPKINTAGLADLAVTLQKLADLAVGTSKIVDGAVTTPKIADAAVGTSKIVDGAITAVKIADGVVTTAKILDGAITAAKLAPGSAASIGVAHYPSVGSGATIQPPLGFDRSECKFFVTTVLVNPSRHSGDWYARMDSNNYSVIVDPSSLCSANILVIAKKGGW